MTNFHIGQKVVCVNVTLIDHPLQIRRDKSLLMIGAVYTIRDIDTRAFEDGAHPDITIRLEEIHNPTVMTRAGGWEPGFMAFRFRPVRTTSIDVFTAMLAPTPRVKEPAA